MVAEYRVTRSQLRKVRSLISLIGRENLHSLPSASYQCVKNMHIYTTRDEIDNEIGLSVWDAPKEKDSAQCLFADKIYLPAFLAALNYWHIT